jgi:hypothetical protein
LTKLNLRYGAAWLGYEGGRPFGARELRNCEAWQDLTQLLRSGLLDVSDAGECDVNAGGCDVNAGGCDVNAGECECDVNADECDVNAGECDVNAGECDVNARESLNLSIVSSILSQRTYADVC